MRVTKSFSITSLILAIISFFAAAVLTVEKIASLKNPTYVPSCNLSPFISCGPVMNSAQASAFGIPNSIVGMVGFGLIILIMFTSLFVQLPRWYWVAYTLGIVLASSFIVWLMVQALLVISSLCIYCMIVWACMILLIWLAIANITKDTKLHIIYEFRFLLIGLSYIAIISCIFFRFQDYWLSLL